MPYIKGYVFDTAGILASPAHWDKRDWATAGGAVAATGLVYTLDAGIRRAAQRNYSRSGNDAAKIAEHFGNGAYTLPAFAGAYGIGELAHDERLRFTGLYGFEAIAVSGLFEGVLKGAFGRHRPYTGDGRASWDGPRLRSNADFTSFPSGHATAAFAGMTMVAMEYEDSVWVPPLAYAMATATAVSRVYQDKHWGSDVVMGGAIGYFTSRAIFRYHRAKPAAKTSFLPELQPGPNDIRLVWRY